MFLTSLSTAGICAPTECNESRQTKTPSGSSRGASGGGLHYINSSARFTLRGSRIHTARFRRVRRRLLRFAEQALTSQRGQTRHRAEILLLVTTGQHLRGKHLVKRHTRRHNRQVLVVQAVGQHHKT